MKFSNVFVLDVEYFQRQHGQIPRSCVIVLALDLCDLIEQVLVKTFNNLSYYQVLQKTSCELSGMK